MANFSSDEIQTARASALRSRDLAMDLYAISFATYPKEWQVYLANTVNMKAIEFAIHARKIHDILNISGNEIGDIDAFRGGNRPELNYVKSYWDSVNHLIHGEDVKLCFAEANHNFWLNNENTMIAGIDIVRRDQGLKRINIFGLVTLFLTKTLVLASKKATM